LIHAAFNLLPANLDNEISCRRENVKKLLDDEFIQQKMGVLCY
jgi:hypothetical protein